MSTMTIQIRLVDEHGEVYKQTSEKIADAEDRFADLSADLESMGRE